MVAGVATIVRGLLGIGVVILLVSCAVRVIGCARFVVNNW